jgi:hypothetical protein
MVDQQQPTNHRYSSPNILLPSTHPSFHFDVHFNDHHLNTTTRNNNTTTTTITTTRRPTQQTTTQLDHHRHASTPPPTRRSSAPRSSSTSSVSNGHTRGARCHDRDGGQSDVRCSTVSRASWRAGEEARSQVRRAPRNARRGREHDVAGQFSFLFVFFVILTAKNANSVLNNCRNALR